MRWNLADLKHQHHHHHCLLHLVMKLQQKNRTSILLESLSRRKGKLTQHRNHCYEILINQILINIKAVKKRFNSAKITV